MTNNNTINFIATEMQIRNFRQVTITSYLFHIESFLDFAKYPIEELTEVDVKNYLSYLYKKGKSICYISTAIAACRFLFRGFGIQFDNDILNPFQTLLENKMDLFNFNLSPSFSNP